MVVAAEKAQMDPKGLSHVEELFNQQIETGVHPGAALAVYRHGMPVIDLQRPPTGTPPLRRLFRGRRAHLTGAGPRRA